MSNPNKDYSNEELFTEAESILKYMTDEIKKWNGWACLSISKPGSGEALQQQILSDALASFQKTEKDLSDTKETPKWADDLVPVQIHKEVPVLGNDGLYRAYTNRTICFVKITNLEFGGLVCDRGQGFCVGDPFALESSEFPIIEEEAAKVTKQK